ncbi:hypothetical protein DICPUDRAFT_153053 [Dictyostelium purpureum]|uniref:Peptidase S10, serine carboxypeptidase n=1 Tax=Dictyostelium purpureum TaxID=5786 RepID=F0ZMY1_DICPU|nr:uncharacterized protein DICPUDRAFT_153053 [Dictyostelium purpureum]EGC34699.1 hypothetical protein DICPUDRAFT_153053 [Dictyostelium purpureum]|eukprot:XP_003288784.1 hypothetical protein DICPUDRAFT_153053 [Dictyostelium purpureum]
MKFLGTLISLFLILSVSFGQIPNNFESGFFLTNETTDANLFFLFYPAQTQSNNLLIFLSGGPGCSSELAAFFENGPYFVNPNLTLYSNPYSWNTVANVLYIDSPVGTGFSYPLVMLWSTHTSQYGSLGLYAYTHSLIDYEQYIETQGLYESCKAAIKSGDYNMTSTICNQIMSVIQEYAGDFNPYDVTKTCPPSEPLCYDFTPVSNFLNQASVKQQLGVSSSSEWNLCNTTPYNEIIHDWFNSPIGYIPTLLENYKVLVYSGINGWICNFIGSEQWMGQLDWTYSSQYNNAPRHIVYIDQQISGYYQSFDNLAFFSINGAGHMAPHDQPATTLEMVKMFLNGTI